MRLGEGDAPAADAVREARERAAQLDHLVARLTITFTRPPPAGAEVRVDEALVDPRTLGDAIRLDPGPHSVTASAPATASFRTAVTLPEGSRLNLAVDLQPVSDAEIQSRARVSRSAPVGGYVALGIGGALAAGSVVSFVLRASSLATLQKDCAGAGNTLSCPESRSAEVNGARNAAQVEGPLGIGLGLGAAIAVGVGVWRIVTASPDGTLASPHQSVRLGPMLVSHGGGIVLSDSL